MPLSCSSFLLLIWLQAPAGVEAPRFAYRAVYINSASCPVEVLQPLSYLRTPWSFCLANEGLMTFITVFLALVHFTVADMLEKTVPGRDSGHMDLGPTLEEPSASWLLQEDDLEEAPEATRITDDFSNVEKRPALPAIPDVLILTFAALTLGLSVLLRELCRTHDQKPQKLLIPVKPSEATDAFGCTELHVAASEGSALIVRRLLEGGSDPNAREAWEDKGVQKIQKCF
eukprot:Skav216131  [mRNA]  locus=scaffold1946:323185:323871:+ [translate_table: standard]